MIFGTRTDRADLREILHREMIAPDELNAGTISAEVAGTPREIGLDPFFRLLDRNYRDNRVDVARP